MLKGVNDKKEFFAELLVFFAPYNVILSVWGKLTPKVLKQLALFKAPCSWIRRLFFSETEWNLTPQSLSVLKQCLCNDEFLGNLTGGIRKDGTPLGLCRSWDDMDLNGSELMASSSWPTEPTPPPPVGSSSTTPARVSPFGPTAVVP